MANRGDVISVDRLWDVFDIEREKAWDGVDAPVGSPEWNVAAGKVEESDSRIYHHEGGLTMKRLTERGARMDGNEDNT